MLEIGSDIVQRESELRKLNAGRANYRDFYYFLYRASLKAQLAGRSIFYDMSSAIEDLDAAIALEPSLALPYQLRGEFLTLKLMEWPPVPVVERENMLRCIRADYEAARERKPTDVDTWLDIIEVNLLMENWDEAIGTYGDSAAYVETKKAQFMRALLGCVALALAGERIEEEDIKPLHDGWHALNDWEFHARFVNLRFGLLDKIRMQSAYRQKWREADQMMRLAMEAFASKEKRFGLRELWKGVVFYGHHLRYEHSIELRCVDNPEILPNIWFLPESGILNK